MLTCIQIAAMVNSKWFCECGVGETTDKACLLCDPRRKAYEWAAVSAATVCVSVCWCQIPTEFVQPSVVLQA